MVQDQDSETLSNVVNFPLGCGALTSPPITLHDRLYSWRHRVESGEGSLWELVEREMRATPRGALELVGMLVNLPVLHMAELHAIKPDFTAYPHSDAVRTNCLIARDGGRLIGVVSDPFDAELQSALEVTLGTMVDWHLAHPADLLACLYLHVSKQRIVDSAARKYDSHFRFAPVSVFSENLSTLPECKAVSGLVDLILRDAVRSAATAIHIEAGEQGLRLAYRINGLLGERSTVFDKEWADRIVEQIRVMAGVPQSASLFPHTGRFQVPVEGREVHFEVSIVQTPVVKDVVIRVLNKIAAISNETSGSLEGIGFDASTATSIRRLISEPGGLVLVAGSTGSGKTTTMRAMLRELSGRPGKIVSVEDHVETCLPDIVQIQANGRDDISREQALLAAAAHDADTIVLPSIDSAAVARQAIDRALSGQRVVAGIMANNVFDALARLDLMGVDPRAIGSALQGVLSLRLVRLVCMACAVPDRAAEDVLKASTAHVDLSMSPSPLRGQGCEHCAGTGYKGVRPIGEVMHFNDELREAVVARASIRQLRVLAKKGGMRCMRDLAHVLASRGKTTLEEVNRAVGYGSW